MDIRDLEFRVNQVIYQKVFDDDECEKIASYYQSGLVESSVLEYKSENYSPYADNNNGFRSDYRKSMNKTLSLDESGWIKDKLLTPMKEINDKFFQLQSLIFGDFEIMEYKTTDEFKWHADMGTNSTGPYALRRISLVVFISDRSEYEGGQLEFMPKLKEPLKMEKGYMAVFPSHKLHRVSPITSGIRRTLVNWLYEYRGP